MPDPDLTANKFDAAVLQIIAKWIKDGAHDPHLHPGFVPAIERTQAALEYEAQQHEITKQTLDQAWTDLHHAREELDRVHEEGVATYRMYNVVRLQLEGAPHEKMCDLSRDIAIDMGKPELCTCWKDDL